MKIIEPGKQEFEGCCKRCGCLFSYTLEDLKNRYPLNLKCPYCDREYYHPDQDHNSAYNDFSDVDVIYTTTTNIE